MPERVRGGVSKAAVPGSAILVPRPPTRAAAKRSAPDRSTASGPYAPIATGSSTGLPGFVDVDTSALTPHLPARRQDRERIAALIGSGRLAQALMRDVRSGSSPGAVDDGAPDSAPPDSRSVRLDGEF